MVGERRTLSTPRAAHTHSNSGTGSRQNTGPEA